MNEQQIYQFNTAYNEVINKLRKAIEKDTSLRKKLYIEIEHKIGNTSITFVFQNINMEIGTLPIFSHIKTT